MSEKSGIYWINWANANAPNSKSLTALEPAFGLNVLKFIDSLVTGGATVKVEATRRSAKRAYLFHWCWMIYLEKCQASAATGMSGVDIQWDHGDKAASIKGAGEMVTGFGLALPHNHKSEVAPALKSNHIDGKAIDMDIKWYNKIKVKKNDGKLVELSYQPHVNSNTALIEVGKSFGIIKHLHDAPHWSFNGR